MARLKKALDGKNSHIFTLRVVIVVLVIFLFIAMMGWNNSPKNISIDIPPDLRSGSTRGIDERHPFNIYAFGYYIYQQMNYWPVEGVNDYQENIQRLSCYITPKFKEQLKRDYEKRLKDHELNRARALQEMQDRPYSDKRVFVESKESWVAYYDVNVKETFKSETVKNIFIRYPIRIVKWDVNPECNLWGLALDGFYRKPARLENSKQISNDVPETSTTSNLDDES